MKLTWQLFAALVTCSVLAQSAPAADPALSAEEQKEGWKLLFDGKSTEGWMSWKTKQPLEEGKWVAEDGVLTLNKGGGDIYTADAYENFELSLEFKTTGNSGIFIRVNPEQKGAIYSVAPEIQVNKDSPKSTRSTSCGGLYALYDIEGDSKKFDPNGWNEIRVRLVNGHGTHWMNGQKLYEYQIGSEDWKKRVAASKFKGQLDKFGMLKKGHIGLQDHGNQVSFRNIKIRVLSGE